LVHNHQAATALSVIVELAKMRRAYLVFSRTTIGDEDLKVSQRITNGYRYCSSRQARASVADGVRKQLGH